MKTKIDSKHIFDFENRNFKAPELAKTILANKLENELLILSLDNDQLISNRAMWMLNHLNVIEESAAIRARTKNTLKNIAKLKLK